MRCSHCGQEVSADSKFCPNCGSSLPGQAPASPKPAKKKTPVWLLILVGVAVFLGAGIFAAKVMVPAMLNAGNSSQETSQTVQAVTSQPAAAPATEPRQTAAPATEPPQATAPAAKDTFTVSAYVPSDWDDVHVWAWHETKGNAFDDWPGEPMQKAADGWYTCEVPNWCGYVIINGNDGNVQSVDITVQPDPVWLVVNSDQTCQVSYTPISDPVSISGNTASGTYGEIFNKLGIQDTTSVDASLDSLSVLLSANSQMVTKVELGYTGETVKEIVISYYYNTTGMTDSQKEELNIQANASFFMVNDIDGCTARFNEFDNYYTVILRLNCLDDPDAIQALSDMESLGDLDWLLNTPPISDIRSEFTKAGLPMK